MIQKSSRKRTFCSGQMEEIGMKKHIHSPFQRILSLVLCLTMLLPAIIVPGSASETA